MIKMAIYSKLNNSKGKNLVQRIKNKGIAYIAPIMLLVGCSNYDQAYINNHYQINLTHNGGQGEIISNEKPKFLGIHWSGREQKYSFDVNQDSINRISDIQPQNIELKKYCDDKNSLPFNEECYFSPNMNIIHKERIDAKQKYLRNEWPKFKEITIRQLKN